MSKKQQQLEERVAGVAAQAEPVMSEVATDADADAPSLTHAEASVSTGAESQVEAPAAPAASSSEPSNEARQTASCARFTSTGSLLSPRSSVRRAKAYSASIPRCFSDGSTRKVQAKLELAWRTSVRQAR